MSGKQYDRESFSFACLPFFLSLAFLLAVVGVEFAWIMYLNNGFLVYTLDDPYIHLALAENIRNFHYGVNPGEPSSPASSILWPFLLAPFSSLEYFPLAINILCAALTVAVFTACLQPSLGSGKKWGRALLSTVVMLLILNTNQVGLIFLGMEHSLQVLLAAVVALGLIRNVQTGRVPLWLPAAIVTGPLVRYENLTISLAALLYLLLNRYYRKSMFTGLVLLLCLAGFSLFLVLIGLDPMPASITVKSSLVSGSGKLHALAANLQQSLSDSRGIVLALGMGFLLPFVLFDENDRKRKLALTTILAMAMHLLAGKYGWYNRYEIYIWTYFVLVFGFLAGGLPAAFLETRNSRKVFFKLVAILAFFAVVSAIKPVYSLFTIPLAANNIYEQQYQMHRFVTRFYKQPVAVNDLGYVSYKNDGYVLDLWGLASREAFHLRRSSPDSHWMDGLAEKHNVHLVMIYDDWFPDLPPAWVRVGEMTLSRARITPARKTVVFYATKRQYVAAAEEALHSFISTLPPGIRFHFADQAGLDKNTSP
jgi:hypothetical protein